MRRNHPHPPKKKHNQKTTSADNTLTGIGKQQHQQQKKNK